MPLVSGCGIEGSKPEGNAVEAVKLDSWESQFREQLPLLGQCNRILVVDKAFPLQTAPGMEYVNSVEKLLPALQFALQVRAPVKLTTDCAGEDFQFVSFRLFKKRGYLFYFTSLIS